VCRVEKWMVGKKFGENHYLLPSTVNQNKIQPPTTRRNSEAETRPRDSSLFSGTSLNSFRFSASGTAPHLVSQNKSVSSSQHTTDASGIRRTQLMDRTSRSLAIVRGPSKWSRNKEQRNCQLSSCSCLQYVVSQSR
jgi:hypothetical protein